MNKQKSRKKKWQQETKGKGKALKPRKARQAEEEA